jgi:hypothetical protein
MTEAAEPKRWRVEMADRTTRVVEARGFRVEGEAYRPDLLLLLTFQSLI